jgi:tetratricopeptide (TPR) repeat protein
MKWDCLQGGIWLERRQSGLSAAEGLQLEEHLAHCEHCRRDADRLDALRQVISSAEDQLGPRVRERIIRNALAAAPLTALSSPARHPGMSWSRLGVASAGALAAAAAVLWLSRAPQTHDPLASSPVPAVDKAPASPASSQSTSAAPPFELAATPGRDWSIGPARVRVGRATLLRWQEQSASLHVGDAQAQIEIELAPDRPPVRVFARSYIVEVSAARFEIGPSTVTVFEGALRVLTPDGQVVVPRLAAGEAWPGSAVAPEPRSHAPASRAEGDAGQELRRARALLAQRKFAESQRAVGRALRAGPDREQRAEALSLTAENALMTGDEPRAQRLYSQVAERYRELDAGDNALFAAARIAQRRGQIEQSRALLQRYVIRYPGGRFRVDADRRLGDLGAR